MQLQAHSTFQVLTTVDWLVEASNRQILQLFAITSGDCLPLQLQVKAFAIDRAQTVPSGFKTRAEEVAFS